MTSTPEALLEQLNSFFIERGFTPTRIEQLQPADAYLDTVGEDLRRRIFLTQDNRGQQLCLRPEFTIPVCRDHIASNNPSSRYTYGGRVFRQRGDLPSEFLQSGVEMFGAEASDADCLELALEALETCGVKNAKVILGDKAIFKAFLKVLDLPEPWRIRLARAFGDQSKLDSDLKRIAENGEAILQNDPLGHSTLEEVTRLVELKMQDANLPQSGGRRAEFIAKRMLEKHELASASFSENQRKALISFLNLEAPARGAHDAMNGLLSAHGLSTSAELDARVDHIVALGQMNENMIWKAGFGRQLDYYNGIVFEIFAENVADPVCGGGRYDGLLQLLGSAEATPATGFSIWIDRIAGETT